MYRFKKEKFDKIKLNQAKIAEEVVFLHNVA